MGGDHHWVCGWCRRFPLSDCHSRHPHLEDSEEQKQEQEQEE